jgi:protein involved in polysaccharide export with SLBB domain
MLPINDMNLSFDLDTAMTANTRYKLVARLCPLLLILVLSSLAHSQELPDSTTSPADSPSAATPSTDGALPASAIIELLREKPELMVDLKHQAAEQLQAQGVQIQEDSITDEMLLGKIVSDASVRANITLWLRARGYVTAADIEQAKAGQQDSEDDDNQSSLPSMPRMPTGSDSNLSQLNASRADAMQSGTGLPSTLSPDLSSVDGLTTADAQRPATGRSSSSSTKSKTSKLASDASPDGNPQLLRRTAPMNLMAMRDLYTQVPDQTSSLKRFGSDLFLSRGMQSKQMTLDMPVGPDYVLGPGDSINISLWGGLAQQFSRVVDRGGEVSLPEAGPIVLAGSTLSQAQTSIQYALARQFRDAKVEVSVARLRTVRVYVVGDVQRPGAYDVSSLSTPLNALYAAGGPTAIGSLRTVRHYRGKELIREVDLYEFLLHGVRSDTERLEPGDTILIPPVRQQITISGMVRRPAIYELRNETTLSEVLTLAGGVMVSAQMRDIRVERIEEHDKRITLSVNVPPDSSTDGAQKAIEAFKIQDGDKITVAPILPYSERSIYLEGHVVRPGKYPYSENMTLNDVIRSYQDVLPEPSEHGEIVRLRPPDYRPETIEFNLSQVLIGNSPVNLQAFDTVRLYGRYEIDAPSVAIHGEVRRPGQYPLPEGLTAAQLVRMAGGFKRSALLDAADLASYSIKNGEKVVTHRVTVNIGRAVEDDDSNADVLLKPGDVLTIHQISGWNNIGASVSLKGEVTYPGMYGIQEGEKLSSVLKRAGGFTSSAYPTGAVLVRNQVREMEQKGRDELIRQIETTSAGVHIAPTGSMQEQIGVAQLVVAQQREVVAKLKSQPPTGRLVIKISSDIASWENTPADIELRAGDVLTVPKQPGFVLVSGQVYNAVALTYVPGKSAGWYLRHAGGATNMANTKEVFVIRANGSVVGRRSGEWYSDGVLDTKMEPGDVVVVPQKILGGSMFWRNMLATAQVLSSIAITANLAGAL